MYTWACTSSLKAAIPHASSHRLANTALANKQDSEQGAPSFPGNSKLTRCLKSFPPYQLNHASPTLQKPSVLSGGIKSVFAVRLREATVKASGPSESELPSSTLRHVRDSLPSSYRKCYFPNNHKHTPKTHNHGSNAAFK